MADREKVIKEAEKELEFLAPDDKHRLHMGIMMKLGWIYDALELLKEKQWIPAKDKMPTPGDCFGKWYIVCDRHGQVFPLRYVKTTIRGRYVERWQTHYGTIYYGDVVAWMPLPKPYAAENNAVD